MTKKYEKISIKYEKKYFWGMYRFLKLWRIYETWIKTYMSSGI